MLAALSMMGLVLVFCPYRTLADDLEPPSSAEEESVLFEDIPSVFGASKYEQKITEAPSSISIVTAAEIEKYGYRTVRDILNSLPGFYTSYDYNYDYIGVRGFNRPGDYNTRVLLLIDNHRINDNIYDQAPIGTDLLLDIDLIDRVEVIRGPSSSIYGSNAFFGVVNIITKRGRDLKGFEVSGAVGSYDTYKGRFSYGSRFNNGIELLLSGTLSDSEGQDFYFKEFDAPETNCGKARGLDDENYYSFFLNGVFMVSDSSPLKWMKERIQKFFLIIKT